MLARMALMICVVWLSFGHVLAEERCPHVVVVVSDGLRLPAVESLLRDWESSQGDLRVSPSRAATLAAIMFGKPALQSGVVIDGDWRSRAVDTESIFTLYCDFGDTLNAMAAPQSPKPLVLGQDPSCLLVQQGGVYGDAELAAFIENQITLSACPVVFILVDVLGSPESSQRGRSPEAYHYEAKWRLFQKGSSIQLEGLAIDYQLNEVVKALLSGEDQVVITPSAYQFFHRANWPAEHSVEKYRHKDSLVIGHGFALVDGIELYRSNASLEPDLEHPLDIAEYATAHTQMLVQHGQWWQKSSKALLDKRSITVGENPVKLTAQDWRPSNIIHPDGTSPSSKPLILKKDLLAILRGLQDSAYRETFPAYSGAWSLNITQPGRYRIIAKLLPSDVDAELGKLKSGHAFVRLGGNKVQLRLNEGADSISATTDADAGVVDLECWFTGQLPLERELGAFFVEIERVGDKKFNLPIGH